MAGIQEINLLLVEDNRGDARLIQEMLKDGTAARYACTVAENLTLALSQLENKKFDIVMLDLNLPESSGIETLDRIIGLPGIMPPVIVLTGLDDEAIGMSAIERGAEDFLIKNSVNAALLSRSIRYAIERKRIEDSLRESDEIFRQFMEHSPVYVFFKDEKIRSLRLSKNYEAMLGKSIDEMLGKTMDEMFPSDLSRSMIADDLRILKEGKRVDIEEELNGRSYTTIKFPILHKGKPRYLAGFTIDITERKRAEKDIIAWNRDLAILHKTAIDLVSIQSSRDLYAYVVSTLHDITGAAGVTFGVYDPVKREIRIEHAELDRVLVTDLMRTLGVGQLGDTGFPLSDELRRNLIKTPVGVQNSFSDATFGAVPPEAGNKFQEAQGIDRFVGVAYIVDGELYGTSVLGFRTGKPVPSMNMLNSFASMTAVTLRRIMVENSLRENKERYRSLVEAQHEAVCRWLPDTTLTFVNESYCRLVGKTREELTGEKWIAFIPENDRAGVLENYAKLAAEKKGYIQEHEIYSASGILWYRWNGVPLFNEAGNLVEFQSVGHDITERKKAEEIMSRQLDELRRWQEVMLEREGRVIELKKDINDLLRELGRPEKYGD